MKVFITVIAFFVVSVKTKEHQVLFCQFERDGTLYDQSFNDPPASVECRDRDYCQKITANYNQRTNIVLKGCDGLQVPSLFRGVRCQTEGCTQITDNDELYTMCCCSGNDCNTSSSLSIFLPILISSYVWYNLV